MSIARGTDGALPGSAPKKPLSAPAVSSLNGARIKPAHARGHYFPVVQQSMNFVGLDNMVIVRHLGWRKMPPLSTKRAETIPTNRAFWMVFSPHFFLTALKNSVVRE